MTSPTKGKWIVKNLEKSKVPANVVCDFLIINNSQTSSCNVGVRTPGSQGNIIKLDPKRNLSKKVRTDQKSRVELYFEKNSAVEYTLMGFFQINK